jgi:hypothetical protein
MADLTGITHVTQKPSIPSVPTQLFDTAGVMDSVVRQQLGSVRLSPQFARFLSAAKENLDVLGNRRSNPLDAAVTFRDLQDQFTAAGLRISTPGPITETEAPGVPQGFVVSKRTSTGEATFFIYLSWINPNADDLSHIELAISRSQDRVAARTVVVTVPRSLIGKPQTYQFIPASPTFNYYFWIRAVDFAGNASPWYPESPNAGLMVDGETSIGEFINNIMDILRGEGAPEYDPNKTYYKYDVVSYSGRKYQCYNDDGGNGITGVNPTIASNWRLTGILLQGYVDGVPTVGIDGQLIVDQSIYARSIITDGLVVGTNISISNGAIHISHIDNEDAQALLNQYAPSSGVGENVNNWDQLPEINYSENPTLFQVAISKSLNLIHIRISSYNISDGAIFAFELEVYGASITGIAVNGWLESIASKGSDVDFENDNSVWGPNGVVHDDSVYPSGITYGEFELDKLDETVAFRLKVTQFETDSAASDKTRCITMGDRYVSRNPSIPWEAYFSPIDSEDYDVLLMKNAPAQAGADVTAENVAASIVNQGLLATKNNIDYNSADIANAPVKHITANSYDGSEDASQYASEHKVAKLIFEITDTTLSWPENYGGIITYWYSSSRATQVCFGNGGEFEHVREVHPAVYPTWTPWVAREVFSSSDVDALLTQNGPSEAGADVTSNNPQDYSWITGVKPPTDADNTADQFSHALSVIDSGAARGYAGLTTAGQLTQLVRCALLSGSPNTDGLWITDTHIGYYAAGQWQTYIKNTGEFWFGTATNHFAYTGGNIFFRAGSDGAIRVYGGAGITIYSGGGIAVKEGASIHIQDYGDIYLDGPDSKIQIGNSYIGWYGSIASSGISISGNTDLHLYAWQKMSLQTETEIYFRATSSRSMKLSSLGFEINTGVSITGNVGITGNIDMVGNLTLSGANPTITFSETGYTNWSIRQDAGEMQFYYGSSIKGKFASTGDFRIGGSLIENGLSLDLSEKDDVWQMAKSMQQAFNFHDGRMLSPKLQAIKVSKDGSVVYGKRPSDMIQVLTECVLDMKNEIEQLKRAA